MSPYTDRGEWISRDPRELSTRELLEDLLGYDDGTNGRGLRYSVETAPVVNHWIRTPRGRELAYRLEVGQVEMAKRLEGRGYDLVPSIDSPPAVDAYAPGGELYSESRLPSRRADGTPGPAIVFAIVGLPLLVLALVALAWLATRP